ncbi:MAG: LysM peptidoglycan-binding domain-containing protein [Lysobacter sp.]|nr:LysM peptidoglycan-binding domain-containing protein [Lysobacter sp.]
MPSITAPSPLDATPAHRRAAAALCRRLGRCLAVSALLLTGCGLAQAQDWSYRVRPGDTLWDLGAKHLKAGINWRRLQEHNRIANPYHLPPGTRMAFPIGWLRIEPAKAKVVAVRGAVNVLASDNAPARLVSEGMHIGIGNRLETGPGASATLEFADSYGSTGMVDTRMRLQRGRTSNRVIPAKGPASRYIIETPSATSSVRGTHFRVSAGDGGAADATEVLEGKVQVGAQRSQVLVLPGFGTIAAAGAAPAAAIALLPAPSLLDSGTRLDSLPANVAWTPVPGAVGYRVEVVRDDAPEVLLYESRVDTPQVRIDDLPAGRQRLLVRAIAGNGLSGRDSERVFAVNDQPLPPLTISPLDGQSVSVPRPRFEWAHAADAERTRLQLARDEHFEQPLVDTELKGQRYRPDDALAPGTYFWRVASRDAAGRTGRFGNALPFTVSDAPVDPGLEAPQAAKGQLTLRWQKGEPGQRYRVQIARKPDFAKLLLEQEVDVPQVELKRPGGGSWYVRVQTLEDDGYAAPYGPAQQIRLPCRVCYGAGAAGAALLLLAL